MKNTFLDSGGKVQIVLVGAVTANQLHWTVSYYDRNLTTGAIIEQPTTYSGLTNSTNAVDIVPAPASGHIRVIKNVTVYNADTASSTVILQLVDGGGTRVLIRNSLTTLASRSADDMSFYTDISGKANIASPTFTGTVTTPTIQLGEASMKLDAALSGAGTWCGITQGGIGGETLAFGDLCYFKASDSKRWKAKADVTATSGAVKLGICVLAGASTTTEILLLGKVYISSLTAGAMYYASAATAGAITATQPTGTTGFVVRVIGYADSTTELYFDASKDYIEI